MSSGAITTPSSSIGKTAENRDEATTATGSR